MGQDRIGNPTLPIIAIPTTAGTGSEVTRFTVITDAETNVKMLIGSHHLIPRVALIDYTLSLSCPPSVTAATGLDALTHALEAYISRRATPISDLFALSALRRIGKHLRTAWSDGTNTVAREAMMLGATEAGIAFTNASVALVHGMARPIGAYFHIPHGLSNAMLIPTIVAFTAPAAPARFADVAAALGESVADLPVEVAATRAGEAISRLCQDVRVPSLAEAGVDASRLRDLSPQMARDALASGSPANNPRVPTADEIVELYLSASRR
jgi:alcohol dehydrogenase class IV